jgi:plastocyanin
MKLTKALWLAMISGFLFTMLEVARGANFTIQVASFSFTPSTLTITNGDTVTWTNTGGIHTTTSGVASGTEQPDGLWNHSLGAAGQTFTLTFANFAPRTYPYYCQPHALPFGMVGSITVTGTNSPPSLSNPILSTNGDFKLTINGQIGQTNIALVSPDLVSWSGFGTNLALSTSYNVTNSSAGSAPAGFYRVRLGP